MARAKSSSKVIFYLIWFKPGLSGRSKKYSTLASTSTRVYLLITVVHAGICFVRITSIFLLFASLISYSRTNKVEQITHLSSCGERNIRQSLISLSSAPNRNCPPKARHSAGRMDAGFFSSSGLKFTLADVLRYVAFVPLDLVNQNPLWKLFFQVYQAGRDIHGCQNTFLEVLVQGYTRTLFSTIICSRLHRRWKYIYLNYSKVSSKSRQ